MTPRAWAGSWGRVIRRESQQTKCETCFFLDRDHHAGRSAVGSGGTAGTSLSLLFSSLPLPRPPHTQLPGETPGNSRVLLPHAFQIISHFPHSSRHIPSSVPASGRGRPSSRTSATARHEARKRTNPWDHGPPGRQMHRRSPPKVPGASLPSSLGSVQWAGWVYACGAHGVSVALSV
ncbi:hypothetical protein GQ53DRAFT_369225 [Thozetella sp. PMI_491]|nr:hypothetical protein GQ53DRAFT_369225 [Thozetella sp. PMI_491]